MNDNVLIINKDADWYAERLKKEFPTLNFRTSNTPDLPIEGIEETEILIALAPHLDDDLLEQMPGLKWIHALTTGLDNLLVSKTLSVDVILSNSNGIHGPQMSELAILLMLSCVRDFPKMLQNQQSKNWDRWPQPLLQHKTACIVGLGAIAEDLASKCSAFGMIMTGVSDGRRSVPGFSHVFPRRKLNKAAGSADFLIVLVPYEKSTHHIVDESVLLSMQPHAILINLSRGGCVDEAALQTQLQAGTLRAAALDVFAEEPLSVQSELWHTPSLTITPHIGGMSDTYHEQVLPVLIDNLSSWVRSGAAQLPNRILRD